MIPNHINNCIWHFLPIRSKYRFGYEMGLKSLVGLTLVNSDQDHHERRRNKTDSQPVSNPAEQVSLVHPIFRGKVFVKKKWRSKASVTVRLGLIIWGQGCNGRQNERQTERY